jgi:hypothetical protein
LGPDGQWRERKDNYGTHERLVEACLTHDTKEHFESIQAPTLIIHAAKDMGTGRRTTLPLEQGIKCVEGVTMKDVAYVVAGKE